jgi:hypothetical protein
MREVSQIDPDGDLIIILSVTGEPFAPWDAENAWRGPRMIGELDTLNVKDDILNPTTEWSFKVSSKHLMLASQGRVE